jgi:hypothetical protein
MIEPVLLTRINIITGKEMDDGGIAADFHFQCVVDNEVEAGELADWICAYFEKRIQ